MMPEQAVDSSQYLRVVHSTGQERAHYIPPYRSRFLVRSGQNYIPFFIDQVAYFCAFDKWTYLVGVDGKRYLLESNLKSLEESIDPRLFFRLNRRYFVRIDAIKCLTPYFKGQVTVKITPEPNEPIVVSRKRTAALKYWMSV